MAAITARYARAFADVILEQKVDAVQSINEVRSLENVLSESFDLRLVWENPSLGHEQKMKVLDAVAAKLGLSRITRNLAAILIDHRRIGSLSDLRKDLENEINARLGLADAQVTSARVLGEEEKRQLESQVSGVTGKKIRATYATDKSVLGGAVVKVGSTVYDGSVRGQLARLKQELIEA